MASTPIPLSTTPPKPPARILSPLRSARLLISLRNQPPACGPVVPPTSGCTPAGAWASSHSAWPPPKRSQPRCSCAVRPNGTLPKNRNTGCSSPGGKVRRGMQHVGAPVRNGVERRERGNQLAGGVDAHRVVRPPDIAVIISASRCALAPSPAEPFGQAVAMRNSRAPPCPRTAAGAVSAVPALPAAASSVRRLRLVRVMVPPCASLASNERVCPSLRARLRCRNHPTVDGVGRCAGTDTARPGRVLLLKHVTTGRCQQHNGRIEHRLRVGFRA